jgi:hypothetical protein
MLGVCRTLEEDVVKKPIGMWENTPSLVNGRQLRVGYFSVTLL